MKYTPENTIRDRNPVRVFFDGGGYVINDNYELEYETKSGKVTVEFINEVV